MALSVLWLLLIGWLAFLWNLGSTGLVDETEPLFAEAARQMTVTDDWITPYFNGVTRFDKPPLIYWLMAVGYKILGVNEWAVRLPSALSAIGLVCLGFYTLRHFGGEPAFEDAGGRDRRSPPPLKPWLSAFLGAALIAFNPLTIAWGRTGVSDMLLTGCTDSALLAFFTGYAQPARPAAQARWYLAFYVLVALAVLTKGPVGAVLPALSIGSFLLYLGNGRQVLREMRPALGVPLMLAIALPWYILVTLANGQAYINSFFGYHNLERFTSVVNHHSAPWYFYFLVVLLGFAPWSVFLPVAIGRLLFWQRSRWIASPRSHQLGLFALFWFASIFGFFTVAVTKLPSYVLPLMPAAAILVALLGSEIITQKAHINKPEKKIFSLDFWLATLAWVNVAFWALGAVAFFSGPLWLKAVEDPAIPNLSEALGKSGLMGCGGWVWATAAAAGAATLLARQKRWLLGVNLLAFAAFLIVAVMPGYFFMDRYRQLPLRQLAQTVVQFKQPGEELVMLGFAKPSLVFYTKQPVTFYLLPEDGINYIKQRAEAQPNPSSVLILGYPSKFEEAGFLASQYQILDRAGTYQLVRVSKQVVARLSRRNPS
ncbi:ArnT family glycosyltransferase [Kamptonema formosum]|uniref:ArnT family glycosyltransferase n=1 Tax=Kamptonema formosum TaxID=331992 RepID=UPI000345A66E